jgi:lipoate-protein ligase B
MHEFIGQLNLLGVDSVLIGNTILIEKYPLPYSLFLKIQQIATEYVLAGGLEVYILTNHSTLLTEGRGDRQNSTMGNQSVLPNDIPLYKIKRGGGVTMHHDHQLIFYPILKLHPERWSLIHHLSWLLEVTRETIQHEFAANSLSSVRNPLGLWWESQKIASVGVGVERFVTQHGIAINVGEQPLEMNAWNKLNPCGLASDTYTSLCEKLSRKILVQEFAHLFKQRIFNRQIPQQLI